MRRQPPYASGIGARAICPICNAEVEYSTLRRSPTGIWQCPRHIDRPRPNEWPNHNHPDDVEPDVIALHHPQIGPQPVPIVDRDVVGSDFVPPPINLKLKPVY